MEGIVLFIHIVVCVLLVIIVLLQSGKSADLAGAFGGVGSQSTFGPRGTATILSKMTTTLAILFMVTSLTLWILASNEADSSSVVRQGDESTQSQPAATPDTGTGNEKPEGTVGEKPQTETEKKTGTDKATDDKKETGSEEKKEKGNSDG